MHASLTLVLPRMGQPAAPSRNIGGAVDSPIRPDSEAMPAVKGSPAISKHSLTRIGTPQRGATLTGGARPDATAASAASASSKASSKRRAVSELSVSFARETC